MLPESAENSEEVPAAISKPEMSDPRHRVSALAESARLALAYTAAPQSRLPFLLAQLAGSGLPNVIMQLPLNVLIKRLADANPEEANRLLSALPPDIQALGQGALDCAWAAEDPVAFRANVEALIADHKLKIGERNVQLGKHMEVHWHGPDTLGYADPAMAAKLALTSEAGITGYPNAPEGIDWPEVLPEGMHYNSATSYSETARCLAIWLRRDEAAALTWMEQSLAAGMNAGLAFHLVDSLNDRAYHAGAADMALKHLPASLAAAAMERIVPAWSAADQKTAAAWEASLPEQQAAFVRQHSSKPAELQE